MEVDEQIATPQVDNREGQGDPVETYYNYLKKAGADVAPNLDSFKRTLSDDSTAQKYYSYLKSSGYDAPPTYDSFSRTLGVKKNGSSVSFPPIGNIAPPKAASESTAAPRIQLPVGDGRTSVEQLKEKAKKAQVALDQELASNGDLVPKMVQRLKSQAASAQRMTDLAQRPASDQPLTQPQMMANSLQKPQGVPEVSQDDINSFMQLAQSDPNAARSFLNHVATEKPDKAASIKNALYAADASDRATQNPEKTAKVLKNIHDLETGKLDYSIAGGHLLKPEDPWESISTGIKNKNQSFADYDLFNNASPDKAISELEKRRTEYDPDQPTPIAKSLIGELTGGMASQPIRGMIAGKVAGTVTTLIPGAEGFAPAVDKFVAMAQSGDDFRKMAYANYLQQHYKELRNNGVSPELAYAQAQDVARKQSMVDAVGGAAMMFAGGKIGELKLPKFSLSEGFSKAVVNGLKQGAKGIGEAGAVGLIQGAGQDIKNKIAQQSGLQTDESGHDIGEAVKSGIFFTLGMAVIAKGMDVISGKTKLGILQGLSKATPHQINSELGHLRMEGAITPQEAQTAVKAIDEHRMLEESVPPNITPENRLKILDKIDDRKELEDKLEKADKAYHPEIKEKIKAINEQILELSKEKVSRGEKDVLDVSNMAEDIPPKPEAKPLVAGDEVTSPHFEGISKVRSVSEDGKSVFVEGVADHHVHEIPIDEITIKVKQNSGTIDMGDEKQVSDTIKKQWDAVNKGELLANDGNPIQGPNSGIMSNGLETLTNKKWGHGSDRLNVRDSLKAIQDLLSGGKFTGWFGKVKNAESGMDVRSGSAKFVVTTDNAENIHGENGTGRLNPKEVEVILNDQLSPFGQALKNKYPDFIIKDYNGKEFKQIKSQENASTIQSDQGQVQEGGDAPEGSENTRSNDLQQPAPETSEYGETQQPAGEGKIISTKNKVADSIREENGLPPVEIPKDRSDDESLNAWRDGTRTPHEIVDQLLSDKNIYDKSITPNDEPIMREYIRGIVNRGVELNKLNESLNEKVKLGDEEAITNQASVKQQLLNHYDEMQRALDAERIGGNIWHKYGTERQMAVNEQGQLVNSINRIRTIYGDDMPPEMKQKLSDLQQQYDALVAKNGKIEDDLKKAQVENDLLKQALADKKAGRKTKKSDADFTSERKDILADMKKALSDANKKMYSAIPLTPQLAAIAPHVFKLFKSFAEQGIDKLEDIITNIHDITKDVVEGISKDDILDILAGKHSEKSSLSDLQKKMNDLRTQARLISNIADLEKGISIATKKKGEESQEVQKLKKELAEAKKKSVNEYANLSAEEIKKQADSIQKQIDKGDYFKMPTVKRKWENNPEWRKNEQTKANLQQELRNLEQKAYDSKKNMYMKSLDWMNRWGRRVIFFGANAVYTKLSSAAVVGAFAHRIPETIAGKINAKMFPEIARNAPIEGNLNAASEAKFYREFLNIKKFAQNIWSQAKTGETPLSKELGRHSNEKHIPIVDLFAADAHAMIKDPVKRATFEAAVMAHLKFFADNSIDGTHPLMLESARQAAYKTAEYEIFQNSSKKSGMIKKFFNELEKSGVVNANMPDGWSKVKGNAQYSASALYHFFVPINTVPLNILKRVGLGITVIPKMAEAMSKNKAIREGILNMSQEESDLIMRQLKKGQIGAAYWTLGFILGGTALGGLYTKYDPDKERGGNAKINEMNFGGIDVPKDVQHNTQFQSAQMGATWNTVYNHFIDDKGASQLEALAKATAATAGAATESIPTLKAAASMYEATQTPYGGGKWVKDLENRIGVGKATSVLQMMGYDVGDTKGGDTGGGGAGGTYDIKQWK